MLDDTDRKEIVALIEQAKIAFFGGIGVLLLMNLPPGSGGSVGFLSAIIGAGVGGWAMTQPWAAPLSLTPRAPGFTQEIADEEQLLERIKPTLTTFRQSHKSKIYRITSSIIGLFGLCSFIRLGFSPAWPGNGDLFLAGMFLFISFLFGAVITVAVCWLSVYKAVLHTMI